MNLFGKFHSFQENDWFSVSKRNDFFSQNRSNSTFFYLPFVHLRNSFDSDARVRPVNVPIIVVGNFTEIQTFCSSSNTFILAHRNTNEINSSTRKIIVWNRWKRFHSFLRPFPFFLVGKLSSVKIYGIGRWRLKVSGQSSVFAVRFSRFLCKNDDRIFLSIRMKSEYSNRNLREAQIDSVKEFHRLARSILFSFDLLVCILARRRRKKNFVTILEIELDHFVERNPLRIRTKIRCRQSTEKIEKTIVCICFKNVSTFVFHWERETFDGKLK